MTSIRPGTRLDPQPVVALDDERYRYELGLPRRLVATDVISRWYAALQIDKPSTWSDDAGVRERGRERVVIRVLAEELANFGPRFLAAMAEQPTNRVCMLGVLRCSRMSSATEQTSHVAVFDRVAYPLTWLHERGSLSERLSLSIVERACRAAALLHAGGLTHGAISTDSVCVCRGDSDGDGGVLLKDLGFGPAALSLEGEHDVACRWRLDHWAYRAPEQLLERTTPASDVFALGVLLHDLLCGRPPFLGATLEQTDAAIRRADLAAHLDSAAIADDIATILDGALARGEVDRPSAQLLGDAVGRAIIARGPPVEADELAAEIAAHLSLA